MSFISILCFSDLIHFDFERLYIYEMKFYKKKYLISIKKMYFFLSVEIRSFGKYTIYRKNEPSEVKRKKIRFKRAIQQQEREWIKIK